MEICKLITVTTRILWRGWAGQRHGKQPVQPPAPLFSSLIIHSLRPIKMPLNSPEDCLDPVYAFSSSDSLSKCFKCSPGRCLTPYYSDLCIIRFTWNRTAPLDDLFESASFLTTKMMVTYLMQALIVFCIWLVMRSLEAMLNAFKLSNPTSRTTAQYFEPQ